MDTLEAIRTIRAVRDYEPRAVPDETITNILNAGRWTGSSKNTQPWQFILLRDRANLVELSRCGNFTQPLTRAAFAIVILTEAARAADYDEGRCTQNMVLAAWNAGVGSCVVTLHRAEDARSFLGFPQEYSIRHAIAFGYPTAEYIHPPRKGGRRALAELLHQEKWNPNA